MLTRTRQLRLRLLQPVDGALFACSLFAAWWLRAVFPWWGLPHLEPLPDYIWLFGVSFLLAPALLANRGIYRQPRSPAWRSTAFGISQAAVLHLLCLVLILFLARAQAARSVVIIGSLLGGLLVAIRHLLERRLADKDILRETLWIGAPDSLRSLRARLTPEEAASLPLSAEFDPTADEPEELTRLLHARSIGLVILNAQGLAPALLENLLSRCEEEGIEVVLRLGIGSMAPGRMSADIFAGEPVLLQQPQNVPAVSLMIKHLADRVIAALLLVLASPLLFLLALLVRLDSPGPVLFRQRRAGINGRPFTLFKFRSMRRDAEQHQEELQAFNEMSGPVFKMEDDPRVTRLGRFLRRHSLDELPQLLNVLRGEMSLVGPRPLPLSEVDRFRHNAHRRRLSVKPGLTCLWQVSGRNDITDFDEWVRLDLAYIDQWSLWLDFLILLRTIPVVFLGTGAR
jgi:exopolysaccharide biosynthesis polyprenyl glycosylphosphotransferase